MPQRSRPSDAPTAAPALDSLYRQSFDLAPIGLGHLAADGRWLAVNAALCELLGHTREYLQQHDLDAVTHPDDRNVDRFQLRRLLAGEVSSVSSSKRLLHQTGRLIRVEQKIAVMRTPGDEPNFLVVSVLPRHIRRVSAEHEDLRKREERYRLAMEGSNDGLWDWNIGTGEVYYSRGWKRLLGLTNRDVRNHVSSWEELIHPDDLQRATETLLAALRDDTRHLAQEFRMRHKSGSYRHILSRAVISRDSTGHAVRMTGTHVDITAIRETEAALRRTQSHLSTVINSLDTGIVTFDLNGVAQHWNRAALDMIGVASAAEVMKPAAELTGLFELSTQDGNPIPPHHWPLARILRGERIDGEIIQLHRLGSDVRVLVRYGGSLVQHPDGTPFLALLTMHDVTSHKDTEIRLCQAQAAFDTTQEGIAITDLNGCVTAINRGFTRITEYSEDDVQGRNIGLIGSDKHDAAFFAAMWKTLQADGTWQGEIWNRRKSGELYPQWLIIDTIRDHDTGNPSGYVAVFNDMTRMKHVTTHLEYLAFHDALTGLANRAALHTHLGQSLQRARREHLQTAVLFLDLDRFKDVNDTLGHAAGDELLTLIAQRLRERAREADTVARLGGDEFVLVLDGITDRESAATVARTIIDKLTQDFTLQAGPEVTIGTSIGIAVAPEDGDDPDALLQAADQALYAAKRDGGGNDYRFAGSTPDSDD